ncbi:MAG TPA: lysophospholipid acyltransferase family protein [Dermatophilaceae bacterium]|nr:lysophospholipid acyltransferase family protein [Dermatophilaceae bacterium]
MARPPRDAFSAGAARAAGERKRRHGTPLVGAEPVLGAAEATSAEVSTAEAVSAGVTSADVTKAEAKVTATDATATETAPDETPAVAAPVDPRPPRSRPHRPVPRVDPANQPVVATRAVDAARTRPDGTRRVAGVRSTRHTGTPKVTPAAQAAETEATAPIRPAKVTPVSRPRTRTAAPTASAPAAPPQAPGALETAETTERLFRPRLVGPDERAPVDERLLQEALTQQELTPDFEDLLGAAIGVLRTVLSASGLGADEVEATIARTLAFARRRLTGDYSVDDFGFDPDWNEHVFLPIMRLLYQSWFRVEVRGAENIPLDGSALIVANHAGTIALDAQIVQVAVHDEGARNLRLLGADLIFQTPLLGALARKQGATLAGNADAERLLSSGEVVGVFPEGFKGVGKPFSERYKLQRFGRGGFVSAAIRSGAPIVPCAIVGSEETYPMLGDIKLLARLLGMPYFPVTPTFPWLGLLGLIPLPSKWIIEFGEPVPTAHLGAAAADDPMLVFDLTDQIRESIQQSLYSLLMLRRSVFS